MDQKADENKFEKQFSLWVKILITYPGRIALLSSILLLILSFIGLKQNSPALFSLLGYSHLKAVEIIIGTNFLGLLYYLAFLADPIISKVYKAKEQTTDPKKYNEARLFLKSKYLFFAKNFIISVIFVIFSYLVSTLLSK